MIYLQVIYTFFCNLIYFIKHLRCVISEQWQLAKARRNGELVIKGFKEATEAVKPKVVEYIDLDAGEEPIISEEEVKTCCTKDRITGKTQEFPHDRYNTHTFYNDKGEVIKTVHTPKSLSK